MFFFHFGEQKIEFTDSFDSTQPYKEDVGELSPVGTTELEECFYKKYSRVEEP